VTNIVYQENFGLGHQYQLFTTQIQTKPIAIACHLS